jgi:transcriptional regulator with XRE-family HTH domain
MSYQLRPPLNEREQKIVDGLRSRTNVANRVASYRIRLGLTQQELGQRAGTKQSRVSELESLQGNLQFDTLDRIARVLGLEIDLVPRVATVGEVSTRATAKARALFSSGDGDTGVYSISALSVTSGNRGEYEPIG